MAAAPTAQKPITKQFTDFSGGLNRTASRTRMKDTELFWNENAQTIGPGQITTLRPPGPTLATIAAGIAHFRGVTLKIAGVETPLLITINLDGSISAVNTLNGVITPVAPPGSVTTACRLTMWQDTPILFGDTNGYFSWDGTTFLAYPVALTGTTGIGSPIITAIAPTTTGLATGMAISGSGIPVGSTIVTVDSPTQVTINQNATATATVPLTVGAGAPPSVRDLITFEGRVLLLIGTRAILISAPGSYTDFTTVDGSTTASIQDSVFEGSITRLLSALELAWIMGPHAVNALSNIQLTGTPLVTTYSNTNIVANVGTVLPSSVETFFRTFLFLAPYGIYAIVGATPQKLSDNIDGLFPLLSLGPDNPADVFTLNEVFVWAVLVTYNDPIQGARPILLCFARNAWFIASQGPTLQWIGSSVNPTTGSPVLYGTDGHAIFPCFTGTGAHYHKLQTKLYDFGEFTRRKQLVRLALEFSSDNPISTTVTLENESGPAPASLTLTPANVLIFVGTGPITFVGTGPITWITGGLQLAVGGNINFSGNYLGLMLEGNSSPFTFSAFALDLDPMGEWTFKDH